VLAHLTSQHPPHVGAMVPWAHAREHAHGRAWAQALQPETI